MSYFVSMKDNFMSGWGMAKDKSNLFVVECDTVEDAEMILQNAKKRPEMKRPRIVAKAPKNSEKYLVSLKHFNDLGPIWKVN